LKRVLIDTDVCLDLLTGREPFVSEAVQVFSALNDAGTKGFVSAISFVGVHYFLRKDLGESRTRVALERFKTEVEILPVNDKAILRALRSAVTDFEDAVQSQTAEMGKIDLIISRNAKDYKNSNVSAVTPAVFLASRRPPFST
jgi:predicted nucleic acid-binding protein